MKYFLPLILLFVNISFCFAGMISFNVTDFKYIKKEAEKGNPYYQGVLANVYLRGNLCQKRDGQLAYKWATLAAEKNNPIGMSVLYSIYKVGMVPTDDKSRQNPQMNFSGPAKTGDSSSTVQGSQSAPIKKKKEEKVGRNDPCPCGSNKKFKKCCGK